MTKNDFLSPLHKERQGHSCCGRLMGLPDVGTLERVTSLCALHHAGRGQSIYQTSMKQTGRGVYSSLITSV